MKVYLAGFNVDTTVLDEMQKASGSRADVTPEVLSAAYARISRDPRVINEIRDSSRAEVERSRKSNSTIIFKMGHHSVAEHAVFNLDIVGLSRFCMEDLEKFRLCSYTEKSQRYITLDNDYVIPEEIKGTALESKFVDMIKKQNEAYFILLDKLKEHVLKKHADLAENKKNHNLLEGWAKEDARYITSLATESQVGLTVNARNLELMLRRFASHPLAEVKSLGKELYEKIEKVAPSIVLFHQENDRDSKTLSDLKGVANKIVDESSETLKQSNEVELVEYTKEGDFVVAASLLNASTNQSFEKCRSIVEKLSKEELEKIFKAAWGNMQFYDSMLREFEYVNLTFSVELSSACFGQLKRHRMSTITAQPYEVDLGVTIPDRIKEIGMDGYFQEIVDQTNEVYAQIKKESPSAAAYVLTNAHRKRVLIRVNARELYHISRLREDAHAQWDIQNISREMTALAKEVMPNTFALIGGKDRYNEIFENIYGRLPKVVEAVLPGSKKIK